MRAVLSPGRGRGYPVLAPHHAMRAIRSEGKNA